MNTLPGAIAGPPGGQGADHLRAHAPFGLVQRHVLGFGEERVARQHPHFQRQFGAGGQVDRRPPLEVVVDQPA
ncbi:hypothetical protein [Amycolatopsis sp. WAC 01416]|uniref:hypothetical protein n=1 Tax=Amycolatopsis sp. WAC 01416 TaxID=2203196 RepID=UPI001F47BACE|nr:hypothetical protein [Amycolatopsis sp. WAC 01416]